MSPQIHVRPLPIRIPNHNQTVIEVPISTGRVAGNHNQTVVRHPSVWPQHNQTLVRPVPGRDLNHNQTLVRG